jgi:alpha-tubulin suppressor-like RCC1 family protein
MRGARCCDDGQLGLPNTEDKAVWKPTRVHELDAIGVLDMACAETATFALCNDTNVYSVGTGVSGQLGHKDMVHEKLVKFRKVGDFHSPHRFSIASCGGLLRRG